MGCNQGGLPGRDGVEVDSPWGKQGCLATEGLKDISTLVQWGAREGFKQGNNVLN